MYVLGGIARSRFGEILSCLQSSLDEFAPAFRACRTIFDCFQHKGMRALTESIGDRFDPCLEMLRNLETGCVCGHGSARVIPASRGCQTSPVTGRFVVSLVLAAGFVCGSCSAVASEGNPEAAPAPTAAEFAPLVTSLFRVIETLSNYRTPTTLPPIFHLPQARIEALVCDQPCNVTAAYLPKHGIYLSENLDPARDPVDRAALLHELVHYLQHGHPKFAGLSQCERDHAEEQEAYDLQNAYLAMLHVDKRVEFFDGDFDCAKEEPASAR